MKSSNISKGMLTLGNIIRNIIEKRNPLELSPDIETNGKITKLMSNFIFVPNIVIDDTLKYMDSTHMKNLVKTELLAFSGILLQSFRVLAEIYGESPRLIVNRMANTSTIEDLNRIYNLTLGNEEIDYVDDFLSKDKGFLPLTTGNEAPTEYSSTGISNNNLQKDANIFLTTYEVQLSIGSGKDTKIITIPVIIYPNIIYTNVDTLVNNVLDSNADKTFMERLDEYRAGSVSLSDLIFATDLVKKYKENKLKNENDFAKYLNKVDKISTIKDLLYNKNSYSKNFNIYIFNKTVQPTIERQIKGSIFIDKYKDKLTDALSAFSVSFVDIDKEQVTIHIDSIPGFSVLNFNMLAKEKDSDISNVIKELMKNRQPF